MAKFVSISNGKVRDNSNAFCEHCYELPKGYECYEDGGCTWCRVCMETNGWSEEELNNMRNNKVELEDK